MKNQSRVYDQEKKALEERKKLAQLQKERAEERQIQELQKLQAAQGGKKVQEKVDWLYAAPSTGSGPSGEELEQYLLGRKTVDKLFKEQDEKKLAQMQAQQAQAGKSGTAGFQALGQTANNARDLAAKVREDPLLAIKQQEQAAYEAARRKYMRDNKIKGGSGPSGSGANMVPVDPAEKRKREKEQEKADKRRRKEERRQEKEERRARRAARREGGDMRDHSDDDSEDDRRDRRRRSGSDSPERSRAHDRRRSDRDRRYRDDSPLGRDQRSRRRDSHSRSPSPGPSRRERRDTRSRSPPPRRRDDGMDSKPSYPSSRRDDDRRPSPAPRRDDRPRYNDDRRQHDSGRSNGYSNGGRPQNGHSRPTQQSQGLSDEARQKAREAAAARLAEMQSSAKDIATTRAERISKLEAEDAVLLEREEAERKRVADAKSGKGTGRSGPGFLLDEYKKMGDQNLGDVIKGRGKAGLQRGGDE